MTPVSIHAPVKVRRRRLTMAIRSEGFNSRTREGATLPRLKGMILNLFQFTHP